MLRFEGGVAVVTQHRQYFHGCFFLYDDGTGGKPQHSCRFTCTTTPYRSFQGYEQVNASLKDAGQRGGGGAVPFISTVAPR